MGSVAIFTIVQDDPDFLDKWGSHYADVVEGPNLYVLEHNAQRPTLAALDQLVDYGVNRVPVAHPQSFDSRWLTTLATNFHRFLKSSYDTVVFTAVDEFLVMRDPDESLAAHLATCTKAAHCSGYEVVHKKDEERPLNLKQLWLPQRSWWYPCKRYSKPIMYNAPLYWNRGTGFASAANVSTTWRDEELLLLHLHRIDYDWCLRRHRQRAALIWSPEDRKDGPYRHNLIDDPEALALWLQCDADDTGTYAQLAKIPEEIRGLL